MMRAQDTIDEIDLTVSPLIVGADVEDHGAVTAGGLYLRDELRALAARYPNFEYSPVVLQPGDGLETGAIDSVIVRHHPKLAGWRGFVCGAPDIVRTLKKKLFLAGMASREIFADAFVEATVP